MNDDRLSTLEKEITALKERNQRVEASKAWETSWFRILSICVITYVIASLLLLLIGVNTFYLSALIPTAGYFLSAQSLPPIKRWWMARYQRNKK